MRIKILGKS